MAWNRGVVSLAGPPDIPNAERVSGVSVLGHACSLEGSSAQMTSVLENLGFHREQQISLSLRLHLRCDRETPAPSNLHIRLLQLISAGAFADEYELAHIARISGMGKVVFIMSLVAVWLSTVCEPVSHQISKCINRSI